MKDFEDEIMGEISEEIAKQIKRQAGKIVLKDGNDFFGKQHMAIKHEKEIPGLGYSSIEKFVKEVAQEYSQIWEGKKKSALILIMIQKF